MLLQARRRRACRRRDYAERGLAMARDAGDQRLRGAGARPAGQRGLPPTATWPGSASWPSEGVAIARTHRRPSPARRDAGRASPSPALARGRTAASGWRRWTASASPATTCSTADELHKLYGLDLHAGRLDEARAHLEEAIAARRGTRRRACACTSCASDLAILLLIEGRPAEAAPLVRRCLLVARRIGLRLDVSEVLFGAACCAAWQGDHARPRPACTAPPTPTSRAALADGSIGWSDLEQGLQEEEQARLRQQMGDRGVR